MPPSLLTTRTADAVVLVQWGAVCAYFIWRFLRFRKLVSLALSVMAMGWLLLGVTNPFDSQGAICDHGWGPKLASLAVGVFLWITIIRVERTGR